MSDRPRNFVNVHRGSFWWYFRWVLQGAIIENKTREEMNLNVMSRSSLQSPVEVDNLSVILGFDAGRPLPM